ncbi:hypothetical protein [Hydrogenophaga sp.]|uniref:hypothetical protein n=1 Tax=Hydrogenophaga sp. TaxID=1904254 RepID=UPI002731755B|nr:hypothetical protein [Hydrogenophaga sp.]MDP1686404.1 hypothetical protein [Hydrogenophaga sp.]
MTQPTPTPIPWSTLTALNAGCARLLAGLVLAAGPWGFAQAAGWESAGWAASMASPRSTSLIEIRQGSDLSRQVSNLKGQGYESAGGERVEFSSWYSSNWTDMRATFMTQLSADTGFIWGLGTGEHGPKYNIAPSLKLGFIHRATLSRRTVLTLRATTTLGGRLREKSCTADYGDIGGVQSVNCRLAASTLEPAETLRYLFNETPRDRHQLSVSLSHAF